MTDHHNVFTYGSLMFPAVWERVVHGQYDSSEATIHGFKRVCVRGREHPALVIARRAAPLIGRLYLDVNPQDLARLDHFETRSYARVAIAVTVASAAVAAHAYLALDVHSLLDAEWNVSEFEQHGLPVFLSTYAVENAPKD